MAIIIFTIVTTVVAVVTMATVGTIATVATTFVITNTRIAFKVRYLKIKNLAPN